jgi:hypothetical protein
MTIQSIIQAHDIQEKIARKQMHLIVFKLYYFQPRLAARKIKASEFRDEEKDASI